MKAKTRNKELQALLEGANTPQKRGSKTKMVVFVKRVY
jgi:hypothetical protein